MNFLKRLFSDKKERQDNSITVIKCEGCGQSYTLGINAVSTTYEEAKKHFQSMGWHIFDSEHPRESLMIGITDKGSEEQLRKDRETILRLGPQIGWDCSKCKKSNTWKPIYTKAKSAPKVGTQRESVCAKGKINDIAGMKSAINHFVGVITPAFNRHLARLRSQCSEQKMVEIISGLEEVFEQFSEKVAEKTVLSAVDGKMHSFSSAALPQRLRFEVITISCLPDQASAYFSKLYPGGYLDFMSKMLYLPEVYQRSLAEGIQIYAQLIVVYYNTKDQVDSIVIHLSICPNGEQNRQYCPINVLPTDLLKPEERQEISTVMDRSQDIHRKEGPPLENVPSKEKISRDLIETFMKAAKEGNLANVATMIKDNPNLAFGKAAFFKTEFYGQTALHVSARNGYRDIVELLLSKGTDVDVKDQNGQTPLQDSVYGGHIEVAKLLISNGANVNVKMYGGYTPLHSAANKGHREVAELLLLKGADANAKTDDGITPLHNAASKGHRRIVELLLSSGADINAKTSNSVTPLHNAKDKHLAELLLSHGAAINIRDRNGKTPLGFLSPMTDRGHMEVKELLRKHGGHE